MERSTEATSAQPPAEKAPQGKTELEQLIEEQVKRARLEGARLGASTSLFAIGVVAIAIGWAWLRPQDPREL